jgi:hypothetical protein
MALTEQKRKELIENSKQAASAFLEDDSYLRKAILEWLDRGQIRRMSAIMRRLFLEGDLQAIAGPRVGRLEFKCPDNAQAYDAERTLPYIFFATGGGKMFGKSIPGVYMYDVLVPKGYRIEDLRLPKLDLSKTSLASMDQFLSQKVICLRKEWVSRADVIRYVANKASGVHSDTPTSRQDLILARVRSGFVYRPNKEGGLHLDLFAHGADVDKTDFRHDDEALDPVLVELLAAVTYFLDSPSVIELQRVVRAEFS